MDSKLLLAFALVECVNAGCQCDVEIVEIAPGHVRCFHDEYCPLYLASRAQMN